MNHAHAHAHDSAGELDDQQVIEEFRANSGEVGGRYAGRRVLLLTTTGPGDGPGRTTPLIYLPDYRPDAEPRLLILACPTATGELPAWYEDLRGREQAQAEAGKWSFTATVDVLHGAERDRLFARAAEADPELAAAQARTRQPIPVIALTPADGGPPDGPLGEALKAVHQTFRQELALLRAEVAKAAESGTPGPGLVLQLRVNCLTFCQGLEFHHHTAEDQGMFPFLEKQHPELAEPLARLRQEHAVVADLLDRLRALVALDEQRPAAAAPPAPETVLAEIDRLADELEKHLDAEEEHLVPVLNAVDR